METASPQIAQLKSAQKASWMAGDFGEIAKFAAHEAETFVGRLRIQPGLKVLDVACGTGNTAIPAARAGAVVVGVDIAPNLLEQARKRATAEKLSIQFEEGDAEALPYPDSGFDIVITMFGAMFAPRPDRVAAELLRVSKPGGTIVMANWTAEGFVGKSFRTTSQWVPPPPGVPAPVLWGDEKVVRERFGNAVSELRAERRAVRFEYPFPPAKVVELFREYFGPTKMAFSRLDESGKKQLAAQLESLWREHNLSREGTTHVEAEYLEVKAIRA
jgi:ubiquinone/menaquinone biosynthesis C-methylase UbiE